MKHVPGFVEKAEELKSKGIDEILLLSGMTFILICFSVLCTYFSFHQYLKYFVQLFVERWVIIDLKD